MTPCSIGFGLLAGAYWDSETENILISSVSGSCDGNKLIMKL